MEAFLDSIALSISLLQICTVVFLLMGPVRRYGFVLGFCILQMGTSLAELWVAKHFGNSSRYFWRLFWTDEIALDLLLFSIIILLTFRAMEGNRGREKTRKVLAGIALLVTALPFVLYHGAFKTTAWFDHTSQLLNFGAAILNLGLWAALIISPEKDKQLMTVSSGFGVLATGVAISYGLRRIFHSPGAMLSAADLAFVLAHMVGAAILCWAFRPVSKKQKGLALSNGFLTP